MDKIYNGTGPRTRLVDYILSHIFRKDIYIYIYYIRTLHVIRLMTNIPFVCKGLREHQDRWPNNEKASDHNSRHAKKHLVSTWSSERKHNYEFKNRINYKIKMKNP